MYSYLARADVPEVKKQVIQEEPALEPVA